MSKDIVAWCDTFWNLNLPTEVVIVHEVVGEPHGNGAGIDDADLVNLEELELRLVHCLAGAIAVGKVVNDWPVVALWPCIPLHRYLATRSNLDMGLSRRGRPMADDIRPSKGTWRNEAEVGHVDGPRKDVGRIWRVVHGRAVIAWVGDTFDDEVTDTSVSDNRGCRQQSNDSSPAARRLGHHRHFGVACSVSLTICPVWDYAAKASVKGVSELQILRL